MKPLIAKPSTVTLIAYAVFALTAVVLSLAMLLGTRDAAFWLIMLSLPLSLISVGFGVFLTARGWRKRLQQAADVMDGRAKDVEIEPADRMPNL